MALIVENGTGLANADSYVSTADAAIYIVDRYGTAIGATWAARAQDLKDADCRESTIYMDAIYGPRLPGKLVLGDQALLWPRAGIDLGAQDGALFPENEVPAIWVRACAWLAYKASLGDLQGDIVAQSAPGGLVEDSVTVGPIEITERYSAPQPGQPRDFVDRFPEITAALRKFLVGSSPNVGILLA